MNIPSLPTDNLYKFLALAGSLSFFAMVFLLIKADRDIALTRNNLVKLQQLIKINDDSRELKVNPHKTRFLLFCAEVRIICDSTAFPFVNIDGLSHIQKRQYFELLEDYHLHKIQADLETRKELIELSSEWDELAIEVQLYGSLRLLSAFSALCSIACLIIGFYKWAEIENQINSIRLKQLVEIGYCEKYCHSCGARLLQGINIRKIKKNTHSRYCTTCYDEAKLSFRDDASLTSFYRKISAELDQQGYGRIYRLLYFFRLWHLPRWKKTFTRPVPAPFTQTDGITRPACRG